jgi:hypothetical protein
VLSFAVLVPRPRRAVPPDVISALQQPDHLELRFRPADHLFWSDTGGTVLFAGWQDPTDPLPLGSHWHVDGGRLTAFTGRPYPTNSAWDATRSWAEQPATFMSSWTGAAARDLGGVLRAVSIAPSGHGVLITDPLSIAML